MVSFNSSKSNVQCKQYASDFEHFVFTQSYNSTKCVLELLRPTTEVLAPPTALNIRVTAIDDCNQEHCVLKQD